MYLRIGSSESKGDTSPRSDLNGAPNLCNAVGEFNSVISNFTCCEINSRFRSVENESLPMPEKRAGLSNTYNALAFP